MSDLADSLEQLQTEALAELGAAGDAAAVESLRGALFGRSGRLTLLLRGLGSLDPAERPAVGKRANAVRDALELAIRARQQALGATGVDERLAAEATDMSAPGRPARIGHLHPLQTVERDLREIFHAFGFEVFEGPEIETDAMNFEALNIPPDHPSRDLWDTLYVAEPGTIPPQPAIDGTILRTHTSPVQVRAMRALAPPIRVITPGRCFRYEAVDASHNFEFFQVEGLVVDRETSLADLKGMLEEFARALYGESTRTRFRPGYYPFTEPSVAFDVSCLVCGGTGCSACGRTGWMTILGAGMVHPTVLRAGGIDPDQFQGYAFGMGLDRITLLRHGIPDLRLLMGADLRFLEQFAGDASPMRVPLSWLRDYVAFDLSPQALAEELTLRGLEVSAIEVSGADWTDVVVGRLLSIERHPNADKLWLTSVDAGTGTPLQIVCGADNISVGQLVPVALVGSVLAGGRRIERTRIRGVESQGMLCSAIELGLGDDTAGIHILGSGDELAVGTDLATVLGEVVLDVDVKPNRGDALSMVGLAREVAALVGASVRMPDASVEEDSALSVADRVSVVIDDPEGCPRFTARYVEGVANGASPAWMQGRLLAAGMRPISAVVDVTNYVMHELGQPMHAYDADAVPEGRIVVRRGRAGELLETIDHEQRTLDERMLVIADAEGAIGLAGIMGGASTEVSHATTRVILESAIFHGPTIRNTARRLGLRSEASLRHEKGIGHHLPRLAADRAARLIAEITGARVAEGIVDNDPEPRPRRVVTVDVARSQRLLGIELDAGRIGDLLAPLEFQVAAAGDGAVEVSVPDHRLDVVAAEDVSEEIARSYGYGRISGRLPQPVLPPFRPDPSGPRHRLRRILAGLGLDEVVTHALVAPRDLERVGLDPADAGYVRVANPLAEAHSVLRPTMAASLLGSLAENVRQRRTDAWIFEVGKTYWMGGARGPAWAETAGTGRYEAWHVGIALMGPRAPRAPGEASREADVPEIKSLVEAMHAALGAPAPAFRSETGEQRHPHLHPGRAARIFDASGHAYGNLGEVDPRVAAAWDVPGRPVMAVVNLPQLLALVPDVIRAAPVPPAQPLDRDLAVVVEATTPVGELLRVLRGSAGPLLVSARPFDEYRGPQVGNGRVSYAIALRFQPAAAGDERAVERALDRIRGALQHHLGAQIR